MSFSNNVADYGEAVYSGVLGKIIGVYLGRPVEGWSYEAITSRFGEVARYVSADLGFPLVVVDDDIAGTFAFSRTVADHGYQSTLTAAQVAETWLNYIVEDRTILWWGGLGRCTEHTAFLRLKAGVPAPQSGSAALNGRTLTDQIGARIFIDAFAMMHPGDPTRSAAFAREAASVSHDGLAVDAAAFFAAMEALAFEEPDIERVIDQGRRYAKLRPLQALIDDVVALCQRESDWRAVRDQLDERYGLNRFGGPCHIATNQAIALAALVLGGDNFQRSLMIAVSAGWDTDSNAGSVGCLNGIRLGLDAITADSDLRSPVADRLLVDTADGGSCVSDAVQEAQKIVQAGARIRGEKPPRALSRYSFRYRGSTQGFVPCPYQESQQPRVSVRGHDCEGRPGLILDCRGVIPGHPAAVSTPVFLDPAERSESFPNFLASPTLYPGQQVTARLCTAEAGEIAVRLYVAYRGANDLIQCCLSDPFAITQTATTVTWRVPAVGNNPLLRFGLQIEAAQRYDGTVILESVDWSGPPLFFEQQHLVKSSIWDTRPEPFEAWVSSAQVFEADFRCSYAVSHPVGTGIATLGTTDWSDYSVESELVFNLHRSAGLVARAVGHRRYYAAVFSAGKHVALVKQDHAERTTLAEMSWPYEEDKRYLVRLECDGGQLRLSINRELVLEAVDPSRQFLGGAAGFLIEEGNLLAEGFRIEALAGRDLSR